MSFAMRLIPDLEHRIVEMVMAINLLNTIGLYRDGFQLFLNFRVRFDFGMLRDLFFIDAILLDRQHQKF